MKQGQAVSTQLRQMSLQVAKLTGKLTAQVHSSAAKVCVILSEVVSLEMFKEFPRSEKLAIAHHTLILKSSKNLGSLIMKNPQAAKVSKDCPMTSKGSEGCTLNCISCKCTS